MGTYYNEDYYPAGVCYDPSAPWNDAEPPETDFDVLVSQTLSKNAVVSTRCYETDVDEDGYVSYITDDTDWKDEYNTSHYTPLELINLFKEHLKKELERPDAPRSQVSKYKFLIQECSNWEEDEIEIIRD